MRFITSAILFTFFTLWSCQVPAQQATVTDPDTYVNVNKKGVIIDGYDAVAFFTEGKAMKGNTAFQAAYKGAIYQFASADNKTLFEANPEKYKVQFGGWCAYAVSQGYTASIDINTWKIQENRLIFQYSKRIANRWAKDPNGYLKKADKQWPGVARKK